ncbi:hypothetical protein [Halorubrum aethiopicum]|uniref:hypothetical protein n=1 Tax=Halorubrum aethiopicum TaxID=1758255 RepID=UPI0012FEF1C2|nr:hypothetical protein [Halorubrum aethiopicum]
MDRITRKADDLMRVPAEEAGVDARINVILDELEDLNEQAAQNTINTGSSSPSGPNQF